MFESVLCKIYKKKVVTIGDILCDVLRISVASFLIGSMIFTSLSILGFHPLHLLGLSSDMSLMPAYLQFTTVAVFVIGLLCLVLLCFYLVLYIYDKATDLIYYICNIKVAVCSLKEDKKE
jgi:hypothetical protein